MLVIAPLSVAPSSVAGAALAAGVLSGIPSTVHALAAGASPLDTVRAAGTIAVGDGASAATKLAAGFAVHGAIALGWAGVLAVGLPRRHATAWGALAGLGIAALDLGIAQRRYPAIAALPRGAQIADHVAFGAITGLVLGRTRRRTPVATRS